MINRQVTERIAGRIPGAELRIIEDGAHMLPDEHPDTIANRAGISHFIVLFRPGIEACRA